MHREDYSESYALISTYLLSPDGAMVACWDCIRLGTPVKTPGGTSTLVRITFLQRSQFKSEFGQFFLVLFLSSMFLGHRLSIVTSLLLGSE